MISFRSVVMEAMAAAATITLPQDQLHSERARLFTEWVMRAVGEAFEKIVVHGCDGSCPEVVRLTAEAKPALLTVQMDEVSLSFDPNATPPATTPELPAGEGLPLAERS